MVHTAYVLVTHSHFYEGGVLYRTVPKIVDHLALNTKHEMNSGIRIRLRILLGALEKDRWRGWWFGGTKRSVNEVRANYIHDMPITNHQDVSSKQVP